MISEANIPNLLRCIKNNEACTISISTLYSTHAEAMAACLGTTF